MAAAVDQQANERREDCTHQRRNSIQQGALLLRETVFELHQLRRDLIIRENAHVSQDTARGECPEGASELFDVAPAELVFI